MAQSQLAVEVFCSYAHEDVLYRRHFETHLSVLKRQGLISLWYDRKILPGANWSDTIDVHLETASVIVLLISADFIASNYCFTVEMKRALERHKAGEARVIPVVVRPCDWQLLPVGKLQALPMDAEPISKWTSTDEAWMQVTAGLRRVIEDLPLLSASAPRAALPKIWMIPYPPNPFFLGRDELLSRSIANCKLVRRLPSLNSRQSVAWVALARHGSLSNMPIAITESTRLSCGSVPKASTH